MSDANKIARRILILLEWAIVIRECTSLGNIVKVNENAVVGELSLVG